MSVTSYSLYVTVDTEFGQVMFHSWDLSNEIRRQNTKWLISLALENLSATSITAVCNTGITICNRMYAAGKLILRHDLPHIFKKSIGQDNQSSYG
jgi:hypothetical protein